MKLLLLGGNGQLGRELRRSLPALGQVITATRDGTQAQRAADFLQPEMLGPLIRDVAPDVVVNAAAYTAVDRAETEREAAFCVNASGPEALARACAETGALLLHYSTDYVFNGTASRLWRETDPTAPLGVYGASKLAGERAIAASGARHIILRTAWVYAAHGNNFLQTMLRLARERDILRVVVDQIGTPTPAGWIADASASLLARPNLPSGLWHLTAAGQTSWHGFAEAIVAEAQAQGLLDRCSVVEAISTADYPTPTRRPAWSVLDTRKLQRDFGIVPQDWRAGLAATLAEMRLDCPAASGRSRD
ncbi:dTDP-4-dehydrorhamnose reductase [Thermomonas sp.]|uniref:dTDP-4-dehydrorhamnose reductase n=1 Tax=Thermomonas sp. TaxID=1971895 RepID=UPI0026156951|nr:dTDP-4-dehydrorhamnose reductase [Thermomonas sp.]MCO5054615.1 dTDP-4-dehydrorhamnose reductase [Thermomonas sp.]